MITERLVDAPAARGWIVASAWLAWLADVLMTALAISLPWSSQATSILIALWSILVLLTTDIAALRRELMSPAGGLPALLWLLGVVGMMWSDVSWGERAEGLDSFHQLLMIPFLFAQFRRSGHGHWVLIGFLGSSTVLLLVSWSLVLIPDLGWRGNWLGVPVKDYMIQSTIFAICAFGLLGQAAAEWHSRRSAALALMAGAALFLANILYVATARTTLFVVTTLLILFGLRQFGWRGALGAGLIGVVLASVVWASSPYLQDRVTRAIQQTLSHRPGNITEVGLRLEHWKKAALLIGEAPVFGHGTGAIPHLFRRDATPDTHFQVMTENPHNQMLTVGVQLGLIGALVLVAMWMAELALFSAPTSIAWFGLIVVTQNIVGSLFNSHLFDFVHGLIFVVGVGVIGGMVRRAPVLAESGEAGR